ncbi:phospholipase [Actinoplanes sp. NPDC051633]|uniref:phospholipase n=1 Tax=Actinoplanes sp. NPDC051633 TaxID=3155670 RepID=UPI003442DCB2
MTRSVRRTLVVLASVIALLLPSAAASATTATKAELLSIWTQPTVAGYNNWNYARQHQSTWREYAFDWTTDYCSSSPDNPLGFDFRLSCWHHDFGYRNYKDIGAFDANKPRLDSMFYEDLKRKCATYNVILRPACYALAWVYYEAVAIFGSIAAVQKSDIERSRRLLPASERDRR